MMTKKLLEEWAPLAASQGNYDVIKLNAWSPYTIRKENHMCGYEEDIYQFKTENEIRKKEEANKLYRRCIINKTNIKGV